jgi:hypothetical protein
MPRRIKVKETGNPAIDKLMHLDRDMGALALLLLKAAAASTPTADLAAKLRVSNIAVYKWLNGSPMSAPYAFVVVSKMKHRAKDITNKKQREQASRLLTSVSADLAAEV